MYWFVTAYCMLYVIYPFLNKVIYSMCSKHLLKFIIILTLLVPIYATIFGGSSVGDFILVIYLYLLMGYLKRNPRNWFEVHAEKGFFITIACTVLFNIIMNFLGEVLSLDILQQYASELIWRYSPVMVLGAIFLFYIFKDSNVKNSKLINIISKTTLGIYLFHENPYLGSILWDGILRANRVYYSHIFILYLLVSILGLFTIGFLIDILRIKLFEEPLVNIKVNLIEFYFSKMDSFINED